MFCHAHLVFNSVHKLLPVVLIALGRSLHPYVSVIYGVAESIVVSLYVNFFTAICVIRSDGRSVFITLYAIQTSCPMSWP